MRQLAIDMAVASKTEKNKSGSNFLCYMSVGISFLQHQIIL